MLSTTKFKGKRSIYAKDYPSDFIGIIYEWEYLGDLKHERYPLATKYLGSHIGTVDDGYLMNG